jgi:hypothetical protein
MPEDIAKTVEADMESILSERVLASSERERAMKLLTHMMLRLWTRFALESGHRLVLTPSQFTLGTYEGKMNWILNETANFRSMNEIELGAKYRMRHSLIAEIYTQKDEGRVRLVFALEDEEIKGKPVLVNYLVYDEPLNSFKLEAALASLRPALPNWLKTILTKSDNPLFGYCKEQLECVGV